jgi:hypothetical protein
MKIRIHDKSLVYDFNIIYYYVVFDKPLSTTFGDIKSFENFMAENHPDIKFGDVPTKYAKHLEELQAEASKGVYKDEYGNTSLYCFICGDTLCSSFSYVGIYEKLSDFISSQKSVNDGYVYTFLAHNWSFDWGNNGTFKIKYWYDKDKGGDAHKIRAFKDKVLFEQENGTIHSMIVSDNYYVHYEGKQKNET